MTPRRYAVLHHTGIARPHFDFLFEIEPNAAGLTALRCPRWPPEISDLLEELPEHRLIYLDYEGPISGDRGSVTRVDAGEIDVADLAIDPPTLGLTLRSSREVSRTELTLTHAFDETTSAAHWVVATLHALPK